MRLRRTQGRQAGQAMIIFALTMVALIGMAALAVDLGNGLSVRANLRALADSAALAGAREIQAGNGNDSANYVALQYLASQLNFSISSLTPSLTCVGKASGQCPANTYRTGQYSIYVNDVAVGGSTAIDVNVSDTQRTAFGGVIGLANMTSTNGARALPAVVTFQGVGYVIAALSNEFLIDGGGTSAPSGDSNGPVYGFSGYGANDSPHASNITTFVQGLQPDGTLGNCTTSGGANVNNHVDGDWGAALLPPSNSAIDPRWIKWISPTRTPPPVDRQFQVNSLVAPPVNQFLDFQPKLATTAPTYTAAGFPGSAQDGLGHWKPGIYNGVAPNGGTYLGGVYKIENYAGNFAPGSNATLPALWPVSASTSDAANAVAFVLDSSDTGSLNLAANSPNLTGLDDLTQPGNPDPTPDPAGTHNIVFWSEPGANGFQGAVTYPPTVSNNIAGITYLPNSTFTANGTSGWRFVGAAYFSHMIIHGGGHNSQDFFWICGLNALIASAGNAPALVR